MSEETAEEWVLEFHGTPYIVNLLCNDILLTLEVEDEESGERWSGEFTAQYIEETTHKAGNFKKFSVFTKMLSSAFSKDNESVFVDLLTLADLELLKARKSGSGSSSARSEASQVSSKKQMKRYVILTYTGEFDRVHYPLPLAFEERPNPVALQRTIRRLRSKLREKISLEQAPASEKEKELRQIVSQLRQENTELRHRVRQSTSRSARSGNTGNASFVSAIHSPGEAIENAATVNADLAAANRKLRRQVEDLKKELTISAEEIEKTKRECAKEVMKWKKKISGKNNSDFDEIQKSRSRQESEMVVDLRKTILSLERELKLERLNKGLPSSRTGSSSRLSTADWNSSIAVQSFSARNASSRRASSASLSTRETQSRNQKNNRSRSMSPLERNPELHKSRNSTVAIITSRNAKNYVPARRETPPRRSTQGKDYSPSQQFSPSSSSSLGKRFDPTAYNLAKETRSRSTTKAWGAGSSTLNSKHRYESPSESGYSSSNSQSSYNSRRSDRSNSERDKKKKKSTTTRKQEKQAELKMIGNRAESPKLKTIPADNTYASNDLNAKANRMHSTFQTLKPSTRVLDPTTPILKSSTQDAAQTKLFSNRHIRPDQEDIENVKINVREAPEVSKTAKSLEIEKNLLDRDSARPIQRGSGGSNLPTTNSTLPRQSFELKNDSSLNLSTSLVEQVNHVDNDISDIDKRIQALQSYLENARANMKTKDERQ